MIEKLVAAAKLSLGGQKNSRDGRKFNRVGQNLRHGGCQIRCSRKKGVQKFSRRGEKNSRGYRRISPGGVQKSSRGDQKMSRSYR